MRYQPRPQSSPNLTSQFFNQSFYAQKINQLSSKPQLNNNESSYVSYQYTKKYFQATRINQLINKTVKTTLSSPYLPENPYNMIGRLLLHDCIFQNIRAYYSMQANDNAKKKDLMGSDGSGNSISQKNMMKEIRIGNNSYIAGWKLANMIRVQGINILWTLLFPSTKPEQQFKKKSKKPINIQINHALGGSLILKIGSPYSAEQNLAPIYFITMQVSQKQQHLLQFSNYIIDDCIRICQSPGNIFLKLFVYTHEQISTEWSFDHIIHNRTKISKQIYKVCLNSLAELKAQYLLKVPTEHLKILGTTHIRVTRTYVLIESIEKSCKIHSQRPVTLLLTSLFPPQSSYLQYLVKFSNGNGTPEQIIHQLHAQMHSGIIYALQEQRPQWVGWCLYFIGLYDMQVNEKINRQLKSSVMIMIDSPLGYLDTLHHQINVTKLISSKSSSTNFQLQLTQLLQKCYIQIQTSMQKQQHIYPQTMLFFQSVHRNLQLILQQQKKPNKNIKPILQRIQLLFKYLLNSFYQICFVLKGHILNQIINIDNQFGKDGSGQLISTTITYDIFLRKYKDLPDRTLKINQQIKKYRPIFNRSDEQVQQLILAKYVQQYKLYQQIYNFYWKIICGKKLIYPMGQFVNMLRNQAIRFDSKRYKNSKKNINFDIQQTKTDGIMIYQKAADSQGQHLFYALSVDILQDQNINNFRTIKQIFQQYFQNDLLSQKSTQSLSHLQKNSYILSISTQICRLKGQQSDFNKCKIYIDSIYHVSINANDMYRLMYDEIIDKLQLLQKNGFGVIGIYNGDKQFLDQDQVHAWIDGQQRYQVNFIRYMPKKHITIESLSKLLKNCKTINSQILIRGIFWLNGLLKSCQISLNFLINKQWLLNHTATYNQRVFMKHQDIAKWGNYNGLKQYIMMQKKIDDGNKKFNRRQSLKEKYFNNHIDLIQFVAQDMQNPLQLKQVRTYSPFYSQLQQSLSLVQGIFYLLQYVKTDRFGKFQVKNLTDTIQMLQYYLFDRCLRMDRYIYSQGLSVTIINLVTHINRYLYLHPDNNGEERQLIYLQKITIKLINCIHYMLTSCAFGVIQAIQHQFIKQDQSDHDDD